MKYKDYNDYELIYMVRENDDLSKNLLFKKYGPVVGKISLEFYNRYRDYGYDYEDFYQEALVAFDKAISSYNENKDTLFYTFLVLCIKRSLLSFTRNISNTKKNINNNYLVEIDEYNLIDENSDIENIYAELEIYDLYRNIIYDTSISIEDSSMLELRINGFSWREVGILLDMSSSSTQFRFNKLKKIILDKIQEYKCK